MSLKIKHIQYKQYKFKNSERVILMKVEVDKLILNEVEVIEEMLDTGIIPQFYNTKNVLNRLYRYYNGNVDEMLPALKMLGIVVDRQYVEENISHYTDIQPLSQGKTIEIYKSELDKIKKLKSRTSQRTAFGLLMFKKIVNKKCNRQDNILRLDSINEIFDYVTNVDNVKAERQAWYDMQQNGIINVDWDCNIDLQILKFDGETVETIKNKFDDCNYWFDKLVPENTNLETIVAVLPDGTFKIYKNEGFRGTATRFEEDYKIKADGANIRKCCLLQKKHYKKNIFFILDEERYELEKEQYIETMIKERQDLLKKKK